MLFSFLNTFPHLPLISAFLLFLFGVFFPLWSVYFSLTSAKFIQYYFPPPLMLLHSLIICEKVPHIAIFVKKLPCFQGSSESLIPSQVLWRLLLSFYISESSRRHSSGSYPQSGYTWELCGGPYGQGYICAFLPRSWFDRPLR